MFRVGGWFGLGRLDPWSEARWFVASHFLLLVPVAFAAPSPSRAMRGGSFAVKRKQRLAEGGET